MAIDKHWLKLAAHSKLIYNITRNVRAIFMSYDDESETLRFLAYFTQEPTDWERELISDAACETAVEFGIRKVKPDCLYSAERFGSLEKLDDWLFVRAEEIDEDGRRIDKPD